MDLRERRNIARAFQVALIVLAIGLAIGWAKRKAPGHRNVQFQVQPPDVTTLVAGDVEIFNIDTTVSLLLKGDRIYAGLSPKMVAKIRAEITKDDLKDKDTSGLGGAIAKVVKEQVAEKIASRMVYDLKDIRDIEYREPRLVIEWKRGGEQQIFGNIKVSEDGDQRSAGRFRPEDAERFIAAVRERQRALEP